MLPEHMKQQIQENRIIRDRLISYIKSFTSRYFEIDEGGKFISIEFSFKDVNKDNGTFISFQSWDENRKHPFLKDHFEEFIKLLGVEK